MLLTPKVLPYCVAPAKSKVIVIAAAPVAGVYEGKVIWPLAGVVNVPVLLKFSACAPPTAVPSTYRRPSQAPAAAPFTKYIDAVCAAPSESYTVSEVARLKLFGSAGLNVATEGGVASAG